jgi:hypothetical protein
MAAIGKVSAVFTASTGGLTTGVNRAASAFGQLGGSSKSLTASLRQLEAVGIQDSLDVGPAASAASSAFSALSARVQSLGEEFRAGLIDARGFAASMAALTAEAATSADGLTRAAAINRQFATSADELFQSMDNIRAAAAAGGLSQEVLAAASSQAIQTFLQEDAAIRGATVALDAFVSRASAVASVDIGGENPFAGLAESFSAAVTSSESYIAATQEVAGVTASAAIAEQERASMMTRVREIEASMATATQQHAAAITELDTLYGAGAMSAESYTAAVARQGQILANADGSAAAQASAMRALSAEHARGAQVTLANMTAQQRYQAEVADLSGLLRVGAINQQTFDRAVKAAGASMRSASTAANGMSGSVGGITSRLNVLIGLNVAQLFGQIVSTVSSAVGSFIRMGVAQAQVVDQTAKLATRLGVTYGEMAGLSVAAQRANVSLDDIGAAATRADVAFVKASAGSAQAVAAFGAIGLAASDLDGLSSAARFDAIAVAIAALPTEAERAAAAVRIFGQSGSQLLPLFNGGAGAIAAAREEAERFGLALTNAQGQDISMMNDAFTRAQQAVAGVVQQVVAYLAPAVQAVTTAFSDLIGSIGGANIGQAIGDGILQGARFLAQIGDFVIQNFGSTFAYLSQVGQQWGAVVDFFNRTALFLSGIADGLQAAFGIIIQGISGPVQSLIEAAQYIGEALGFDTSSLDAAVAGMQAFNSEISSGITENLNSAAANFGAALAADAPKVGQAITGPLTTALDAAVGKAKASAAEVDKAATTPVEVRQTVEIASINEALKGIDSRSTEGVAEMFRLMRGQGADVQQQQLNALEQIAENTAGGEDLLVAEF